MTLVSTEGHSGQPWFVAKDVCRALGLGNVSMAVEKLDAVERDVISSTDSVGRRQEKLDEDEKATVALTDSRPGFGPQSMQVISESGLYALVLRCRDAIRSTDSDERDGVNSTDAIGSTDNIGRSTMAAR